MKRLLLGAAVAAAVPMLGTGAANAAIVTLDFAGAICGVAGNSACGNGTRIGQSYGDTAQVDVSHASYTTGGTLYEPYVKHWSTGYGDLTSVAWGGANATNYYAEFVFTPTVGFEVRLLDFSAGCYLNRVSCRTMDYSVRDSTGVIASGTDVPTLHPGHVDILLSTAWSDGPLTLRWGPDSYDVGLDSIRFEWRATPTVTPPTGAIPEPATWAMLIAGFGLVGATARRRRTQAVTLA